MITAAYLTSVGVFGLILTIGAQYHLFRRRPGQSWAFRYYQPQSFIDGLFKSYLIYGMPLLLGACLTSGVGMNIANLLKNYSIENRGLLLSSFSYSVNFYLLAPALLGVYGFLSAFGVVIIDQEQSGPAAGICPFMSGFFAAVVTELLMLFTTSNFESPEMSALWWSFALSGPISFLNILWARSCASD